MQHLRTLLLASTLPLLGACAASNNTVAPAAPIVPPLSIDLDNCRARLTDGPLKALNAGEVEHDWKADRAEAVKVNACLRRVVCQYHDVRKKIGKIETERVCAKGS